mgnify:CR=1 FL=1
MLEASIQAALLMAHQQPVFPMVLVLELPLYALIVAGIVRYRLIHRRAHRQARLHAPRVSCVITCYSEGPAVQNTIRSLAGQIYPGPIEILAVVDGASANRETWQALQAMRSELARSRQRVLKILPKWQRGGRVSSMNAGLQLSRGEIVMALDGDTSFDNNMVAEAVSRMADPAMLGLTGTLRVRNRQASLWTRFQALEYLVGLIATRTGLGAFNLLNNVSGAFGVFRRDVLTRMGGWECGTAEDLDMTMRLKRYGRRRRDRRIGFEPYAIGHTDVPAGFRDLLKQRLRWDGDLFYIYARKHRGAFAPGIMGWPNLIATLWYGLLHQIVLPFVIVIYLIWILLTRPAEQVLAGMLLIYGLYLLISLVMTVISIAMLSERRVEDLPLLLLLPLFPLYRGVMRLWSTVAILAEIVLETHKDSSMAPWWILKRSRY